MPAHATRPAARGADVPGRGSARLATLLVCGALVLALCAGASARAGVGHAYFPLDSAAVAVSDHGTLVRVFDQGALVPGTRVLAAASDSRQLAVAQRAWLAAGTIPVVPELGGSTMVRDALLDLHVLSTQDGVAVAGYAPAWRYVWPRDSALVATALARTGHAADAERVLTFLERVQPETGVFAARYRPDGTGVPDGRGPQTDSLGWVLWALSQVSESLPAADRVAFLQRHHRLLDTSTRASLALVDNPHALPPPSSDYWETKERSLTLSTAALVRAGLGSAATLYRQLGDAESADRAEAAATRTAAAIQASFAADGYPRTVGGTARSVDLGVSYLLPPFVSQLDPEVRDVWADSGRRMARPAGGLAPGGSWHNDGVSWTTATSSYAMTAAFVDDREEALERLQWLDRHRTRLGSLPEKVLADGDPASVAPLAWAAASVIIAASQLETASR